MTTFQPRLSILPTAQRNLWPRLAALPALGYVLYDGTAIALRLGHRASVDYDFFTDRPLDKSALHTSLDFRREATVLQDQPDTLTVNVFHEAGSEPPVKVSFFGDIDFGRFSEPDTTSDGTLQVASLDDLTATKLKVMLQRVEARDYRDMTAMLESGQSLARGLAIARAMFDNDFQPSESLKALTWFQGGDLDRLAEEEKQTLIEAAASVNELPNIARLAPTLALPLS